MNQEQANQVKDLAKPCNDVLEKIGWKWEPKWRDLILTPTGIWMFDYEKEEDLWIRNDQQEESYISRDEIGRIAFSILHWEEIERVLEGVGYDKLQIDYANEIAWSCEIYKNGVVKVGVDACKSRQEAVMQAVIELGKKKYAFSHEIVFSSTKLLQKLTKHHQGGR